MKNSKPHMRCAQCGRTYSNAYGNSIYEQVEEQVQENVKRIRRKLLLDLRFVFRVPPAPLSPIAFRFKNPRGIFNARQLDEVSCRKRQ